LFIKNLFSLGLFSFQFPGPLSRPKQYQKMLKKLTFALILLVFAKKLQKLKKLPKLTNFTSLYCFKTIQISSHFKKFPYTTKNSFPSKFLSPRKQKISFLFAVYRAHLSAGRFFSPSLERVYFVFLHVH
jgi:hypothetical protein